MHQIYTTKAIIIKSIPVGEANKLYFLLTKDLGFIKASAQGVRKSASKLKSHLQDLCLVNISVVKGREIWRIVGVETISQRPFIKDKEKILVAKNIFSLLLRLLHGEEKNEALFDNILSLYDFLSESSLSKDDLANLETIIVLRILYHLGYFKRSFDLSSFAEGNELSLDLLNSFNDKRRLAIKEINEALSETHL
ncbi:MAG: DNA repair protein RecO [Candidatus Paceibacterota bacterium]|jgi:DNA repair protein RecO (recombination protein O)